MTLELALEASRPSLVGLCVAQLSADLWWAFWHLENDFSLQETSRVEAPHETALVSDVAQSNGIQRFALWGE